MIEHAAVSCAPAAFAELSAEVLRRGKAVRFRAGGESMFPLVRNGDIVQVRRAGSRGFRFGDVVLCRVGPGRLVVHRVIRRSAGPDGPRYTIQGDRVARPDGILRPADIWGRVEAVEREGVEIVLDWPYMRLLGLAAALRSRWKVGRGRPSWPARRLIKRLPPFSRYLT